MSVRARRRCSIRKLFQRSNVFDVLYNSLLPYPNICAIRQSCQRRHCWPTDSHVCTESRTTAFVRGHRLCKCYAERSACRISTTIIIIVYYRLVSFINSPLRRLPVPTPCKVFAYFSIVSYIYLCASVTCSYNRSKDVTECESLFRLRVESFRNPRKRSFARVDGIHFRRIEEKQ